MGPSDEGAAGVLLSSEQLLRICVVLCIVNVGIVLTLAGTGMLRTAQTGDITYVSEAELPGGETVSLPDGEHFVIEDPTDVDFFYNIVTFVQHGGSLYPREARSTESDGKLQLGYKYSPMVYYLFLPLTALGYVAFKLAWLAISLAAVVVGTYLLIRTEFVHREMSVPRGTTALISSAAVGFQPMVANFKTGQTTPLIYLFIAVLWWYHRRGSHSIAGTALVGATLIKPYFAAPLALFARRGRFSGLVSFAAGLLLMNGLAVGIFGTGTVTAYYRILLEFLFKEGDTVVARSFDGWSPSSFRPFYWLGPYDILPRALLLLPPAYLSIVNLVGKRDVSKELLSVALIALMLVLQTTSAIDLAIMLVVLVLLGVEQFHHDRAAFHWTAVAFVLLMGHGYVLELLTGWGARNLEVVASNEALVFTLLPALQLGTYGVLVLLVLVFRTETMRSLTAEHARALRRS